MQRLKLFLPLLIFFVIALVFFRLETRMISGEYIPSELPSAKLDQPLPDFSLPLLGQNDRVVSVDALRQRPFLLNVWATWCISCRVEHAYLNRLSESGVPIYGLNYKDDEGKALAWLERLGNPYVFSIFDGKGQLGLDLGVYGAPETYIIDGAGIIRYRHVGVIDDKVWQETLSALFSSLEKEAEKHKGAQ